MKDNPDNRADQQLKSLLKQWRIDSPLPPRFRDQVWSRIEANNPAPAISLGPIILAWLRVSVARPGLAYAYALLMISLSVGAGFAKARDYIAQADHTMESRYVQFVDPYGK